MKLGTFVYKYGTHIVTGSKYIEPPPLYFYKIIDQWNFGNIFKKYTQ